MKLTSEVALKIRQHQQEFDRALRSIQTSPLTFSRSPLITTTTILLSFDTRFDIRGCKQQQCKSSKFSNQTTIKAGNASLKVFENGKVHVTGIRSLAEACKRVESLFPQDLVLQDFKFQMINLKFRVNRCIPLAEFIECAGKHVSTVFYDPSRYPGVRVKMPPDTGGTLLVFATGSVLLAGAKTPAGVSEMVGFAAMCLGAGQEGGSKTSSTGTSWADNISGFHIDY